MRGCWWSWQVGQGLRIQYALLTNLHFVFLIGLIFIPSEVLSFVENIYILNEKHK